MDITFVCNKTDFSFLNERVLFKTLIECSRFRKKNNLCEKRRIYIDPIVLLLIILAKGQ